MKATSKGWDFRTYLNFSRENTLLLYAINLLYKVRAATLNGQSSLWIIFKLLNKYLNKIATYRTDLVYAFHPLLDYTHLKHGVSPVWRMANGSCMCSVRLPSLDRKFHVRCQPNKNLNENNNQSDISLYINIVYDANVTVSSESTASKYRKISKSYLHHKYIYFSPLNKWQLDSTLSKPY